MRPAILTAMLALAALTASIPPSAAREPWRPVSMVAESPAPRVIPVAPGPVANPPEPHRAPGYHAIASPRHGYGVPTYPYGYFGAKPRSMSVSHKGYYGDLTQWYLRSGY